MPSFCLLPSSHVLVVEDDEALATLLRYNLEAAGCTVEWVRDGIAAIRQLAVRLPQLVVLDWNIPGLSGIEVLRQLKRVQRVGVPVLMLTGRTETGDRSRALALGVDAYIAKPFAIAEVMTAAERLLVGQRGRASVRVAPESRPTLAAAE